MEKKQRYVGFYDSGTGKHQSNTVWGGYGICPTITTAGIGASQQIKLLKKVVKNERNNCKRTNG